MRQKRRMNQAVTFVVVVLVIVSMAALGPLLLSLDVASGPGENRVAPQEFQPDAVVPAGYDTGGAVAVPESLHADGDGQVVLVDATHGNDVATEDLQSLVVALTDAGHTVEFLSDSTGFEAALARADALVVVDPQFAYDPGEVDAVEQFVDRGGRLLLVGEPNRKEVSTGGVQVDVVTRRSHLTALASRFGVTFGAEYLYDMEQNDGNYRHLAVQAADDGPLDGVETATFYTAAPVYAEDGTPVLVTHDSAKASDTQRADTYPVAVRTGNVLAVGDSSFLDGTRATVADNEQVVAHLAAFLLSGEKESMDVATTAGDGGAPTDADDSTPTGTGAPTTTPSNDTETAVPTPNASVAAPPEARVGYNDG